jgi:hypothetical protein
MTKVAGFTTITPRQAEKYIEAHEVIVRESGLAALNRIINDNQVTKYGDDMKRGAWVVNGETIKIAKSGRVIDGQHRLWACVNSGAPFKTLVVEGFEENEVDDAFVTTDIGGAKIPSSFLTASGVQYAGFVAPAARYILCYNQHKSLTKKHMVTTPDIVRFGKDHSERLVDSATFISKYQGYVPGSIQCAWHYLMFEKNQEEAAKFIVDLKEGIGLHKGDPVHAMRERLIQGKGSRTHRINAQTVFALGLNMWNDRRKGISRQVIKSQQLDYSKLPKLA